MSTIKELYAGKLKVRIYESRSELGKEAAKEMVEELKRLLKEKEEVNIVFAAAPSQNEFLEALVSTEHIEWKRINAFHMDEYIGLGPGSPQSFSSFLTDKIFKKADFKSVNYIDGNAVNPQKECLRYANLLNEHPIDIVCMGIGENGHIAFNDPHVALFDDPESVKIVELDNKCKLQQVHDGCFKDIDEVPNYAITLTIPMIFSAGALFCMVPGERKAEAVTRTIKGEVNQSCPASILKMHNHATMYLDKASAENLL